MSVRNDRFIPRGEHWVSEEGVEDGDLIVFLIPPVPNYAAPPPPTEVDRSAPGNSANPQSPLPAKPTASRSDAPKLQPGLISRFDAPPVPARSAPLKNHNGKISGESQHRRRSGSFGDTPNQPPNQSTTTTGRPVPPNGHTAPPLPKYPPPATPTQVPPARGKSVSASLAALPQFETRAPKQNSMPPLPNGVAPAAPSKVMPDYSSRSFLLVPVLPVATNGNTSPRESTSNSAPSSTNPSPRNSFQSLPINLGAPTRPAPPTNAATRTRNESLSGPLNSLVATSRPTLRVDDSISDIRVIQEIVITHEDYIKDLHLIRSTFQLPMKERALVPTDVQTIFFDGIGDLIRVEEQLLQELLAKKLQPMDLAQIFQARLKDLQVYIPFCARQDQTLKLMTDQLATNPAFSTFCDEVRKDPNCRGLSFDAFIIKPLQRLCKLPLLFREVTKSVQPHQEEERKRLEAVQMGLEQILDEINKTAGNGEKLLELERNLAKKYPQVESLNLQQRKLLMDGEIAWVVKQTKDQAKLRLGRFWLLDQVLLFCRTPKELDFIMPLNTVSISKNLPPVQSFPYVLELIDMTAQGLVTRKLCTNDKDLYNNLLAALS